MPALQSRLSAANKEAQMPPARRLCGNPRKDICSRSPALLTGLVQQPVQIVASHDLTLFVVLEIKLSAITLQMLLSYMVVRTNQPAFENREIAVNGVG